MMISASLRALAIWSDGHLHTRIDPQTFPRPYLVRTESIINEKRKKDVCVVWLVNTVIPTSKKVYTNSLITFVSSVYQVELGKCSVNSFSPSFKTAMHSRGQKELWLPWSYYQLYLTLQEVNLVHDHRRVSWIPAKSLITRHRRRGPTFFQNYFFGKSFCNKA